MSKCSRCGGEFDRQLIKYNDMPMIEHRSLIDDKEVCSSCMAKDFISTQKKMQKSMNTVKSTTTITVISAIPAASTLGKIVL